MREGWKVPQREKEKVIRSLSEILDTKDPELSIEAAKVFALIESVDIKRAELEMKKQVKDNEHRLRLLELARHAPVDELAKLASQNGIVGPEVISEGGRADSTAGADGSQAGG